MLHFLTLGTVLGLSAGLAPGPLLTLVISETLQHDIRAGIKVAVAPFITGFLADQQFYNYRFWLILHILSGHLMLMAIPFTKLSHFLLFFLSRAQLGMDFGIKRGGMKNKGMAW